MNRFNFSIIAKIGPCQSKMAFLESNFSGLVTEARELYLNKEVPYLDKPPTALQFHKNWVSPNKPVVIRNVTKNWPAMEKWNHQYLRDTMGEREITVAVTPNGYADAVHGDKFVMPEQRTITFNTFLDILEKKVDANGVFYIQKQNSNLTDEFEDLGEDVEPHIAWATQAFGSTPDAVNFWMGDERAVTSMHKDHYENLYCVMRGSKTFTLLPPTDQPFVPHKVYPCATFHENQDGEFEVIDDEENTTVPWIPVDPTNPDLEKYPSFAKAEPVTVTVHEGETLYLPSLWYHHVQQSHGCIAVNYWYDMEYDIKYNYYKFIETLCSQLSQREASHSQLSQLDLSHSQTKDNTQRHADKT